MHRTCHDSARTLACSAAATQSKTTSKLAFLRQIYKMRHPSTQQTGRTVWHEERKHSVAGVPPMSKPSRPWRARKASNRLRANCAAARPRYGTRHGANEFVSRRAEFVRRQAGAIRARQQLTPSAAACGRWGRRNSNRPTSCLISYFIWSRIHGQGRSQDPSRQDLYRLFRQVTAEGSGQAQEESQARGQALAHLIALHHGPADTFSRQHVAHDLQSRAIVCRQLHI